MGKIKKIFAYETIAAGGIPTLSAKLIDEQDHEVTVFSPSFISISHNQAVALKDGDQNRYNGEGVLKAVSYINDLIGPKLIGVEAQKQIDIDGWMTSIDNTDTKYKLGVNVFYVISSLIAKSTAKSLRLPTYKYLNNVYNERFSETKVLSLKPPTPIINIFYGKNPTTGIELDFKQFEIIPSSSYSFSKATEMGIKIIRYFKENLKLFILQTNIDAIESVYNSIAAMRYKIGRDVFLSIDFSADSFYKNGIYKIKDKSNPFKTEIYLKFIEDLNKKYSPIALTDPLPESDWNSWRSLNKILSKETFLVADRPIVSNSKLLQKAVKEQMCSAFILRPCQVGTVSEVFTIVDFARRANINSIFSITDFETEDNFLCDMAVATGAEYIKLGIPLHGEQLTKYNRILKIEQELK